MIFGDFGKIEEEITKSSQNHFMNGNILWKPTQLVSSHFMSKRETTAS